MIFKVQRPLGGEMTKALVYNRDRSQNAFVPYDEQMIALFVAAGNPPKLYVEAEVVDRVFTIRDIVSPQDW